MLSKCLNPDCSAPFDYRQGRLIRFLQPAAGGHAQTKGHHGARHVWLCLSCAQNYRVEFRKGRARLVRRDFVVPLLPEPDREFVTA